MKITDQLFDTITAQAKTSPRLRMNYDLRNSEQDNSQRLLNALEPGTIVPIHRHRTTNETVLVLRGKLRQNFYDDKGTLTESFVAAPASEISGYVVETGRWHNSESLESGTVIIECKDGHYEPITDEDILK